MKTDTKGRQLLRLFREEHGDNGRPMTQEALGERLGVKAIMISRYERGSCKPSDAVRVVMQERIGIDAGAWTQAPDPPAAPHRKRAA